MALHIRSACLALLVLLLSGCGPDTIFLRPTLDTPEQHVKNGNSLLARGKIDAADSEFVQARNLDESYAPAYVGLALVQGHLGNVDTGLELLKQAETLVTTPEEEETVAQGYEQLKKMR